MRKEEEVNSKPQSSDLSAFLQVIRKKVFGPTAKEKRAKKELFEKEKDKFKIDFRKFDPNANIDETLKMALRAEAFSDQVARMLANTVLSKDPDNEEVKAILERIGK